MTEPAPGAGADPSLMQTRAVKTADGWQIDGHKWFASGADGAAFAIVAAVSDANVPVKHGTTLFLVDAKATGYEIVRRIPTMTGGQGGHCELKFTKCIVPDDCVLGKPGGGFALMQQRLGPARLTHCMRWVGATKRCLEIARDYAAKRQAFGKLLRDHEGIQWMFADSVTDLHASRLLIRDAADRLQEGSTARVETSLCKTFVAEAVNRVVDRCMQICGAMGISHDRIIERIFREVRAFRIYDGPSEVHRMVVSRAYLESGELP